MHTCSYILVGMTIGHKYINTISRGYCKIAMKMTWNLHGRAVKSQDAISKKIEHIPGMTYII
jgi:hypothetical protein